MFLKLAWRNVWRNQRRAILTVLSVAFATFLSFLIQALQAGVQDNLLENTVGLFLGYVQVHKTDYWEKQNLDYTLEYSAELHKILIEDEHIIEVVPRLESYVFLQSKLKSKTVHLVGIDALLERYISNPESRIIRGNFFISNQEKAVVLAEGLAKYLQVDVGDSIQATYQNQLKPYLIKAILRVPKPDLNQTLLYMPLYTTQSLFKLKNKVSSLIVIPKEVQKSHITAERLDLKLKSQGLEALSWQKLSPETYQILQSQKIAGQIIISILYTIVAFGVFGTVLVTLSERKQELVVLLSIGMQSWQLSVVFFLEILLLASVGLTIGCLLACLVVLYFSTYPIVFQSGLQQMLAEVGLEAELILKLSFQTLVKQTSSIFLLTVLLSFYPFLVIRKLKTTERN